MYWRQVETTDCVLWTRLATCETAAEAQEPLESFTSPYSGGLEIQQHSKCIRCSEAQLACFPLEIGLLELSLRAPSLPWHASPSEPDANSLIK